MLIWSIWIFERTCSFRPLATRKLAEIVAYVVSALVASAAGLMITYILVVSLLGGE